MILCLKNKVVAARNEYLAVDNNTIFLLFTTIDLACAKVDFINTQIRSILNIETILERFIKPHIYENGFLY